DHGSSSSSPGSSPRPTMPSDRGGTGWSSEGAAPRPRAARRARSEARAHGNEPPVEQTSGISSKKPRAEGFETVRIDKILVFDRSELVPKETESFPSGASSFRSKRPRFGAEHPLSSAKSTPFRPKTLPGEAGTSRSLRERLVPGGERLVLSATRPFV